MRPAAAPDLDALWAIWREPEVRRYLFDGQPVTRERAAEALDPCLGAVSEGLGLWTVRLRADPGIIGCAGLLRVTTAAEYDPTLTGAVEPLVALAPAVWGKGYAREALVALLAYGFDTLRLAQLAAVNDAPNERSDRLLRRLGFEPTGECDGPRHRLRIYRLIPEAFAAIIPRSTSG